MYFHVKPSSGSKKEVLNINVLFRNNNILTLVFTLCMPIQLTQASQLRELKYFFLPGTFLLNMNSQAHLGKTPRFLSLKIYFGLVRFILILIWSWFRMFICNTSFKENMFLNLEHCLTWTQELCSIVLKCSVAAFWTRTWRVESQ